MRTAGSNGLTIAFGGCALLLLLGGIVAVAIYLISPGTLDFWSPDPPKRGAPPPRRAPLPDAGTRPVR